MMTGARVGEVIVFFSERVGAFYTDLTPETRVVDFMGDPETLERFLFIEFSKAFGVRLPRVKDRARYMSSVWRTRDFHISDILRYILGIPEIDVTDMTLTDLAEVAEQGVWPLKASDRRGGAN